MKASLVAQPVAAGARPAAAPARSLGLASAVRRWWPLAGVLGFALFLRVYRLDGFVTYYPDTYAQLRAVDNLLSAEFPISYLYPPGVALALAPVFAVLPDGIATLQATVITAGLALVAVSYVAAERTTGDRRAALFFATAVAFSATFVFYSRMALFDVINCLLIATCFFLAPAVARRGTPAHLAYGVLLFTTVSIRYTNLALLPALFLYSLDVGRQPWSLRRAFDHARSRAVLTVLGVLAALYAAYLGTSYSTLTRFANEDAGSVIEFGHYFSRLGRYVESTLIGYGNEFVWQDGVVALAVLGLAAIGFARLWRTNRSLAIPIAYLLLVWAPVHAVYAIFAGRYAMPAFYFVLLLASLGLSTALGSWRSLAGPAQRVAAAGLLALGVTFFVGRQLALDLNFLVRWPNDVATAREPAYDQIRSALRPLEPGLLVSSQVLAVDRANPEMAPFDLIRHSETYGINDRSVARLLAEVDEQLSAGRPVYYLYTEYEDVRSSFRKYEQSFDAYFAALQARYALELLAESDGRPQVLYRVAESGSR